MHAVIFVGFAKLLSKTFLEFSQQYNLHLSLSSSILYMRYSNFQQADMYEMVSYIKLYLFL